MVVLTKLAIANPLNKELREGRTVEVYRSTTVLGIAATFNTPHLKMRPHLYDSAPAAGDWIAWGDAEFVRLRSHSSHVSAVGGVEIEYSEDGSAIAGNIFVGSALASEWLDSDWLAKKGTHFRAVYLNGGTLLTSLDFSVEVTRQVPDTADDPHREGVNASVFGILNEINQILSTDATKSGFWPCMETTGAVVRGMSPSSLVPSDEAGPVNLEDEFAPILAMREEGFNAYYFSGTDFRHFNAGDHSDYSFEGAAEAFSMGIWARPETIGGIQSLITKYNEAVATEFTWHITAAGLLALILYDGVDGATGDLSSTSTVSVDANELHHYIMTYAGAEGVVTFLKDGELENAADVVTPTETGAYVNMDDTGAQLMVGARDDGGEPQQLLTGWASQPFFTNKALTQAEARRIFQLLDMLVGIGARVAA